MCARACKNNNSSINLISMVKNISFVCVSVSMCARAHVCMCVHIYRVRVPLLSYGKKQVKIPTIYIYIPIQYRINTFLLEYIFFLSFVLSNI